MTAEYLRKRGVAEYNGRVLPIEFVKAMIQTNGPVSGAGTSHSTTTIVNLTLDDGSVKKGYVREVVCVRSIRPNGSVSRHSYYVKGVLKMKPHTPFQKKVSEDEALAIAQNPQVSISTIDRRSGGSSQRKPKASARGNSESVWQWRLPF